MAEAPRRQDRCHHGTARWEKRRPASPVTPRPRNQKQGSAAATWLAAATLHAMDRGLNHLHIQRLKLTHSVSVGIHQHLKVAV